MKRFNSLAALIMMVLMASGVKAQIQLPMPSPRSIVIQDVGLAEVKVEYFRPKMRGRQIFGEGSNYLVPFGQLWRTGANSGTIISFDKDMIVEGTPVDQGSYMVLTRPGKDEWEVIFYGDPSIGGNMSGFKEDDVVASFTVPAEESADNVETWTIGFANISDDSGKADLQFSWENTRVNLELENKFDDEVMAAIKANTTVDARNYMAAANYYYNTDRDLGQALKWANIYLEEHPNEFWNVFLKAQIQAKLGDKKGAKATAEKVIEIAENNPGGDFGYAKRAKDLISSL